MERQSSFRLGALEKLKSFRGMEKQKSFRMMSLERRSRDSPGKRGDTPLHLAARSGSVPHAQKILAELDRALVGEMAARQNQDGETPLYVAAEKGHAEVVRVILMVSDMQTAGIKANNSFDAFHIAAKQGHLEVLKEMLQAFPALAMTTSSVNATALDTAAVQGHVDIVNLLLETDASLARIAKNNGKTVLHSAARMGHVEVVRSLLNKDPGIGLRTDKKGQTALHMASKGQNAEIVVELLKPDASVIHIEDNKGNRPLHVATRKGNIIVDSSDSFISEGIDVNAVNKSGETAFAIAEKRTMKNLSTSLKRLVEEMQREVNPQIQQSTLSRPHDVQSQIKQTRQTKMQVNKIKKRLEKLHIGGLNNAINSNTVVAVLIAHSRLCCHIHCSRKFCRESGSSTSWHVLGSGIRRKQPGLHSVPGLRRSGALHLPRCGRRPDLADRRGAESQEEDGLRDEQVDVARVPLHLGGLIALTYVVVGHDDWWLAWCTMAIGTVIMLTTLGSMCYCIIAHRLEEKNSRKIRKASARQSHSWSRSVNSDEELLNSEYKKMYAL
ncbi:hypothetical protein EJB05_47879 [Eragrostis curvula]|uniref:Uncharacterized protein n=1 Tax=Eragrostis curvula TaxID=38414 RepID=A0A5J9T098_9POAL|nr:hypothetical protein EJB05_47879 [Eragrostis curvula]